MAKIGIITCKKIQDINCIGCIKCHMASAEKSGEFAAHQDNIEVVFWTGCGDCPGLYMPKMLLVKDIADKLNRDFDVIHIGTCVEKAVKTAGCPIDLEVMKKTLEGKFGRKVIIGTQRY